MNSNLYRELTDSELAAVIQSSLNAKILEARLLTGGLFNTTYYIHTDLCGSVVLRLGPVNRQLLMPFEHELMEAEKLVYDRCRENAVPVSEVLAIDTSKTLIDRDFMIVRYIPSRPLNETKLCEEDRKRIYRDIGRHTAVLHGITACRFGRITDVHRGGGFRKWSEFLIHELDRWESVGADTDIFTAKELEQVHNIFEGYAPLLDEIHTPRLVHADLWEGNILIDTSGPRPEFAAIIDADRALWGDPDFEFSSIQWMINDDFISGYGKPILMDAPHTTRRHVYWLLYCLWDAYVFLVEYNDPENMKLKRDIAQELIKRYHKKCPSLTPKKR